jgi:hypothetical protein
MVFIRSSLALILLLGSLSDWAQSAPGNILRNGGFEQTTQAVNLWAGTDSGGHLIGAQDKLPTLQANGDIGDQPMPVSVALGDLNGDSLIDLVTADPLGFIRIYFNSGTAQGPKFTFAEFTTPFLSISAPRPAWSPPRVTSYEGSWAKRRRAVKIGLVDTSNSGKLDIVAGNYFGEIFFIPNRGSASLPLFQQPEPISKALLPTLKDPNHRWGNLFAPLLHDWDGDGRPDLLIGEGSYSANNIHLFLNQGSAALPAFSEERSQVLALGEGRQQLHPALADFDGDGAMDLLVTDREALVTVYLRPKNWKLNDTIRPSGYLSKKGGLTKEAKEALSLPAGINTIATGDLDGDGLFDLIIGKANGKVAWAPNKGSKETPKFEAFKDILGEKSPQASWAQASNWEIDVGIDRGNYYAYQSCPTAGEDANAQPIEGTRVAKFGYALPGKTIVSPPISIIPNRQEGDPATSLDNTTVQGITRNSPSNRCVIRQEITLQIGKTYTLSLQVKGTKVSNVRARVNWTTSKQTGEARTVRGERGSVTRTSESIRDSNAITFDLAPGATWSKQSTKFKVEFLNNKELNNEKEAKGALVVLFDLGKPDGTLYLDDVSIVPEQ